MAPTGDRDAPADADPVAQYRCPVCGHRLVDPPEGARWGVDEEGRRLATVLCRVDGYFGRLPEGTAVPVDLIDEI